MNWIYREIKLRYVSGDHFESNLRIFSIWDLNSDCFAMNFECQMLASTFDGFCFLWTKLPVLWSLYQDRTGSHLHSPGTSPLRPDCLISLYDGIFVLTLSSVKFNRPSFCCPHSSSKCWCQLRPDQWQLGLSLDTSQSITSQTRHEECCLVQELCQLSSW